MVCFISQKMSDLSDEQIKLRREVLKNYVLQFFDTDVEFIPSFVDDPCPSDVNPGVWYLGKSLEQLSYADLFVIAKDDLDSRGCEIEHSVAKAYGINTLVI